MEPFDIDELETTREQMTRMRARLETLEPIGIFSETVTHVEVDAAHLGLAFNPTVWNHVRRALLDNAARIAQPFADGSDNYQRN